MPDHLMITSDGSPKGERAWGLKGNTGEVDP